MLINDLIYHPCSMDIIEHKIIGVRSYEDHTIYEAQATKPVGACGRIKILLHQDNKKNLRFIEFIDSYEHQSGLQDFVEGLYYSNKQEARLKYYDQQEILSWSSMEEKRRLYEQAKLNYERVKKIIDDIRIEIKQNTKDKK